MADDKYLWVDGKFDKWVKQQVQELRMGGLKHAGTSVATKLVLDQVLIPNDVKIIKVIKPIKLRGRGHRR